LLLKKKNNYKFKEIFWLFVFGEGSGLANKHLQQQQQQQQQQ